MKKKDLTGLQRVERSIVKKVFYIKPYFKPKKQSEAQKAGFVGVAGSLDSKGVFIPKNFFINKIYPPGTIATPPRRSFLSGKRYPSRKSMRSGDHRYRLMCSNPDYYRYLVAWGETNFELDPKIKKGLKKYFAHMNGTAGRRNSSKEHNKSYKDGHLRVGGVVKIRKILIPKRKDFFAKEEPVVTGVKIMDTP